MNPPRFAIWLLRGACPGRDQEALTGDLVERFREGRSQGWFWKQVLNAIAVQYWPQFCYASAGTALLALPVRGLREIPGPAWIHWWALPWPWSMLVMDMRPDALSVLAALVVLAAGMAIQGRLRWGGLVWTGLLSLTLIGLGGYLPELFPWLLRPVPGNPYSKYLVIPPVLHLFLWFAAFFFSAVGRPKGLRHGPTAG